MKSIKKKGNWIDYFGIGLFTFLSILEFSSLFQFILRHVLIINNVESSFIVWVPNVAGLFLLAVISIWLLNTINQFSNMVSKNILIKSICVFFGIILVQYFYTTFIYEFIFNNYSKEFTRYVNAKKDNYELLGFVALIPVLKYLVFVIILMTKRSNFISEEKKSFSQISEIGNS